MKAAPPVRVVHRAHRRWNSLRHQASRHGLHRLVANAKAEHPVGGRLKGDHVHQLGRHQFHLGRSEHLEKVADSPARIPGRMSRSHLQGVEEQSASHLGDESVHFGPVVGESPASENGGDQRRLIELQRIIGVGRESGPGAGNQRGHHRGPVGHLVRAVKLVERLCREGPDVAVVVFEQGYQLAREAGVIGLADGLDRSVARGPSQIQRLGPEIVAGGGVDGPPSEFFRRQPADLGRPDTEIIHQLRGGPRGRVVVLDIHGVRDLARGKGQRAGAVPPGDVETLQRQRVGQQHGGAHAEVVVLASVRRAVLAEGIVIESTVPAAVQIEHPADLAEVLLDRRRAAPLHSHRRPEVVEECPGVPHVTIGIAGCQRHFHKELGLILVDRIVVQDDGGQRALAVVLVPGIVGLVLAIGYGTPVHIRGVEHLRPIDHLVDRGIIDTALLRQLHPEQARHSDRVDHSVAGVDRAVRV
ncbi:hypothetical protein Hhel01_04287 [Haloferula helveola]